jgi:tetratricopeptide (TPR) repeat protein
MTATQENRPTPLEGIRYFSPPSDFVLRGRDGLVEIPWGDRPPVPLLQEDWPHAEEQASADYDMVGRGIYQALRLDPGCVGAADYAALLKEAYPHIVSELGGQIVMLDARDVDGPYLDRKINFLRIMELLDPANAGLPLEIARTCVEKGSRLSNLQLAVASWYDAEKYLRRSLELNRADFQAAYEYGEALYVLGRYDQAANVWRTCLPGFDAAGQGRIAARIAAIQAGQLPLVAPLDYLTALSIAVEQHHSGQYDSASAIIEDVLADSVFGEQFPLHEVYYLLGSCYQEAGLMDKAAQAFKRS